MTIDVAGETIILLPERAFFWPSRSLLGFSDVHLGKAHSLQRAGIPISAEAHREDLLTIASLVRKWQPSEIVILGDFIHQKDSWSDSLINQLHAFFREFAFICWTLILGNHERGSERFLKEFPIQIVREYLTLGPLTFTHGHEKRSEGFQIEGHVHPTVRLLSGPVKLRLPCFALEEGRLLLPSFGTLTGGFDITAGKNEKIFAITPKEVFEVKG